MLVIYNGRAKKYTAPQNFFENFKLPEEALDFFHSWQFVNLTEMKKEDLNYDSSIIIPIFSLKYAYQKNKISALNYLIKNKGKEAFLKDKKNNYKHTKNMIYYFSNDMSKEERQVWVDIIINLLPNNDGEKIMATIADSYRKEGKIEGIQEGILLGKQEGILEGMEKGMEKEALKVATVMLEDKEPIEKIIRYTNLSKDVVFELSKKSKKELEA